MGAAQQLDGRIVYSLAGVRQARLHTPVPASARHNGGGAAYLPFLKPQRGGGGGHAGAARRQPQPAIACG